MPREDLAAALGITQDEQVVLMLQTGSRGFGHQVATDYLKTFLSVAKPKYGLDIRDRELASAPFQSEEGQRYFAAKLETHRVDGADRRLLVHRKGATRAFAPGMADIPKRYERVGQPVIFGGSMETGSYLLVGRCSPRPDRQHKRINERHTYALRLSRRAKHFRRGVPGLPRDLGGALPGRLGGEVIDLGHHRTGVDVKAITLQDFSLEQKNDRWEVTVVVDT